MSSRILPVLLEVMLEESGRDLPILFLEGENAEIVERAFMSRVEDQRRSVIAFSLKQVILGDSQISKRKVGLGVFRDISERSSQFLLCDLIFAEIQSDNA